jgi:ABC-2 type transport system ATP-binding protein
VSEVLLQAKGVVKSFAIPKVRRDTLREHVLNFFRPRAFERLEVLRSLDFELRRGETVGIMGRNGCGKSTLLKVLSGVYPPDAGVVKAFAPVTPVLELGVGWNPELDAIDNILLIGTVLGLSLRQAHASVDSVLAFAGLERFANLELKHYSSGMASRLAYSVAFQAVREVLIIDEVFAVGDAGFKTRCEQRFQELSAAGHTVLVVSHDPRTISEFCDRALLLDDGRIALEGSGTDIVAAYMERTKWVGAPG